MIDFFKFLGLIAPLIVKLWERYLSDPTSFEKYRKLLEAEQNEDEAEISRISSDIIDRVRLNKQKKTP